MCFSHPWLFLKIKMCQNKSQHRKGDVFKNNNSPTIPSKGFGAEKIPILILRTRSTVSYRTKEQKLELFATQRMSCHEGDFFLWDSPHQTQAAQLAAKQLRQVIRSNIRTNYFLWHHPEKTKEPHKGHTSVTSVLRLHGSLHWTKLLRPVDHVPYFFKRTYKNKFFLS